MKVLYIVYEDLINEARSQEILELSLMFGDVTVVAHTMHEEYKDKINYVRTRKHRNKRSFLSFYLKARKEIRKKYDIVILHDNITSIFIPYINKKSPTSKIIFDSSEYYPFDYIRHRSLKHKIAEVFRKSEKKFLNKVDVVIAASYERALLMKDYYRLKKLPIVFDNVHRIDEIYDKETMDNKFSKYFNKKWIILYAGGIHEDRKTYELIEAVKDLEDHQLLIVGQAFGDNLLRFNNIKNNQDNIEYLGFVQRNELKYLIEESHITVSMFRLDSLNNIFCASGKVYESLFLNKPVLFSENPPFKRLAEKYSVGVSTSNLKEGIEKITRNYNIFVKNTNNFINEYDYNNKVNNLYENIIKRMSE